MRRGSPVALLLLFVTGCATGHRVTLDTGQGPPIVYKSVETPPIEIDEAAFKRAAAQLVLDLPWGALLEEPSRVPSRHLLASADGLADDSRAPTAAPSDSQPGLHPDPFPSSLLERRMMALSFALDTVWDGVAFAVHDLTDPKALRAMVVSLMGTSLLMLVTPEPVSKLVAVVLTGFLIAYLGTGPVWNMGQAFLQLMEDTRLATSVAQLKDSGHRYGQVIGDNGARVLVLVAMAVLGGRSSMAAQGSRLPGFARAALRAQAEEGFELSAILEGEVHSMALPAAGALNIALAPTAVASVAMGPGGGIQGDPEGEVHHICTDKNRTSDASGGPWTPLFERFFKRAGMELSDPANQVRIKGHQGPHPREYHEEILRRLQLVFDSCRATSQCRAELVKELTSIALELTTPGTRLRKLITQDPGT